MKTLVVDDSPMFCRLMCDILSSFGPCDMAVNGMDALGLVEKALVEQAPYQLILLDIMMPKMDGQVALQAIRAMEQKYGVPGAEEVVILMVTALDSPFAVTEAFFKGYCTDYLVKPITRQDLFDKLREYKLIQA
ncbi:MAG: response regulator [Magnetococcales bacterium]|nr:response regulator [Magnetococcales bacterium]MBF0260610.1 response regulator [Magnetococcales bacterium]